MPCPARSSLLRTLVVRVKPLQPNLFDFARNTLSHRRLLLTGLIICSTTAFAFSQVDPVQRVHHGDLIDVDVVGGFEFDWRGRLTVDGNLDGLVALESPVYALCRTEAEIAADVTKGLSRLLRDPVVVVRIIDRSRRAEARLDGAVRTQMRFNLQRSARLRELIIAAGGLTDGASGDISILRQRRMSCDLDPQNAAGDNDLRTINIKISELLSGKAGSNPQILSGDIIRVERALPVYVIGAVIKPGPLYSRPGIRLSQAIAGAGGLAKDAIGRQIKVFRRDGRETRTIQADLDKIKRGESDDVVLAPFDIIDVAARGREPRKYPPVIAASETNDAAKAEYRLRIID